MLKVKLEDYEIIEDLSNGVFKALRHGEEWRDLTGDNLIMSMLYKIEELQNENEHLKKGIDHSIYHLANEDIYDVEVVDEIRMDLVKLLKDVNYII